MTKAAVIGDPIGHSLSPAIFSFLKQELGKAELSYEGLHVPPHQLASFIADAKDKYIGLNVTLPHKETIIGFLNAVSPEASAIGAVNCVAFDFKSRGSTGFNTDVSGFTDSLIESSNFTQGQRALVLGAGGAARAVTYALGKLKYRRVLILNKSFDRAAKLAAEISLHFSATKFEVLKGPEDIPCALDLIVNATSLGMQGAAPSPADGAQVYFDAVFSQLKKLTGAERGDLSCSLAFDLIYKPESTAFLRVARGYGAPTLGGLDMLIYQALASWQIWFGPIAEKKLVKQKLGLFLKAHLDSPGAAGLTPKALKPGHERIFLTGFMGAGKSTVGKILAKQLRWAFIDTDGLIEKEHGLKISALFEKLGEASFRQLESATLREVCAKNKVIVALGGGTLIRQENLEQIQRAGTLVYLSASSDKLHSRLRHFSEARPLLKHDADVTLHEHIHDLLQVRLPQYKKAAVEIGTDDLEPAQVAAEILNKVGAHPK